MKTKYEFKVGDRVKLTVKFLRSIQDYSAESANARGTIKRFFAFAPGREIAKVLWDGEEEERGTMLGNLMPADKPDID